MSESNLYKQFRNNWKPNYVKRIDPALSGQGFPDCHLVNQYKKDIFVELKFLAKEFKNKKLPIRNSQIIWFLEYKGSHAYFLFKIKKTFYIFSKQHAYHLKDKIKIEDFKKITCLKTDKITEICQFFNNLK